MARRGRTKPRTAGPRTAGRVVKQFGVSMTPGLFTRLEDFIKRSGNTRGRRSQVIGTAVEQYLDAKERLEIDRRRLRDQGETEQHAATA